MNKVIVTGGLGFIGYHLCQRLLNEGIEVILIDQVVEARREIQEEMLLNIGRNALLTLVNERVEQVDLATFGKEIDACFHLAAATGHDSKWPRLSEVIENNVTVTKQLISQLPKTARLIYSSTVEVYGERPGKITEKTPTNPTSSYGITKLASENIIKEKCKKRSIPYVILRLPTVYGPWQREDMTYFQILEGVEAPAIDRSTLDALYVDDVVEALLLASSTEQNNEVFHLTSEQEQQWFEGIKLLGGENLFKPSKIKTSLCPEKALNLLGFKAKTSLQEGLEKQRQHMQQWQKRVK